MIPLRPTCLVLLLALALAGCRSQPLVGDWAPRRNRPQELSVYAGVPRPPEWAGKKDTDLRQAIRQMLQGHQAKRFRLMYPQLASLEERFTRVADRFRIPVNGRLSSPFGFRLHPIYHRLALHTGVDISAPVQTPIAAVGEGQVTFADAAGGDGLVVVIDHGSGISTAYAHCSQIMVRPGMAVAPGRVIALVGRTGLATGPHLHLEVRLDNRPQDPLFFLPGLRNLPREAAGPE